MAQFNPQINKTNDPNYMGYSKPITAPESNKTEVYKGQVEEYQGRAKSYEGTAEGYKGKEDEYQSQGLAALFKGVGDMFQSTVKATDQVIKSVASDQIYREVDKVRDAYTAQLEQLTGLGTQVTGGGAPADGTGSSRPVSTTEGDLISKDAAMRSEPDDVLPPNAQPTEGKIPLQLQNLPGSVDKLVSARANDKISDTYYQQRLLSIAKEFRTRYPGYREFIDDTVHKATGENPANSYVRSLVSDLNAMQVAGRGERDKVANELRDKDLQRLPDIVQMQDYVRRGGDLNIANTYIQKARQEESRWKYQEARQKAKEGNVKEATSDATIGLDQKAVEISNRAFNSTLMAATNELLGTGADVQKWMREVASGERQMDDNQARKLGAILKTNRTAVYGIIRGEAIRQGWADKMDPEDLHKRIEGNLKMYDMMVDDITNNHVGFAFSNKNWLEDQTNRTAAGMMRDEKIGDRTARLAASRKLFGDQAVTPILNKFLGSGYATDLKNWAEKSNLDILNQDSYLKNGIPLTVKEVLKGAPVMDDPKTGKPIPKPEAVNEAISWIDHVTDPKSPNNMAESAARSFFSPGNRGMLRDFTSDRTDANNRFIPGKETVFNRLTDEKVTQRIMKMGDPVIKKDYVNWVENTFSNDIFRQPVQDVKTIPETPGLVISYGRDKPGDAPKFVVSKTGFAPLKSGEDMNMRNNAITDREWKFVRAQDTVDKLNKGLKTMSSVATAAGYDVDTYMLNLFTANGVDPTDMRVNSIAGQMVKAIAQSRAKPETGSSVSKFTEDRPSEPQRGSLGEFLSNPARGVPARIQNAPTGLRTRSTGNLSDEPIIGQGVTGSSNADFGRINPAYAGE